MLRQHLTSRFYCMPKLVLTCLLFFTLALPALAQAEKQQIIGSSFLISPQGHLLTCSHVLFGASSVTVIYQGKEVNAQVMEDDKVRDIALLKLDEKPLHCLPLYTGELEQGVEARAFGYPLARLLGSDIKVTRGSVSGFMKLKNSQIIQMDTLVNSGNSGGPLVNQSGAVIGLVFAKLNPVVGQSGFGMHAIELKRLLDKHAVPYEKVQNMGAALEGPALVKQVKPSVLPVLNRHVTVAEREQPKPARPLPLIDRYRKIQTNTDGFLDGESTARNYPGQSHPFLHEAFREVQPEGSVLIGFSISTNNHTRGIEAICGLQPVYRRNGQEVYGKTYGSTLIRSQHLVAREGYAVAAIKYKIGLQLDCMQLVYQKIENNRLIEKDAYESVVAGTKDLTPNHTLSTNGLIPVGIHGFLKRDRSTFGLGLVMKPAK